MCELENRYVGEETVERKCREGHWCMRDICGF